MITKNNFTLLSRIAKKYWKNPKHRAKLLGSALKP
jgi:hypothetical protein